MLSTVLIIDKRKELSIKYKKSIDNSEINTIIARTLKDALVFVQTIEPDMIIISDSIEEKVSDFCHKIRALTYNTRPVIIALSKSAEIEDRITVLEAGADDFISEPVNIDEFKMRIKAHIRRDVESNLDNKTLLPNQKYVKKALKRVLALENQGVLLIEFENLDKYKQIYTELAADKIVQTFVAIVKSALSGNDFLGQYDEKTFVVVTNKFNAEKLASFIIFAFDTVAPKFYSEIDAKRGYMLLKNDDIAGMRANFVSLLIGGIVESFDLNTSVDSLLNRLFEVKKIAKVPSGSNFAIERTLIAGNDSVQNLINNKKIYIQEKDDALRYLIRTSLELQGYDVIEEIDYKNAVQPALLIIDCGNAHENLDLVRNFSQTKNFANTKIIATSTNHNKMAILDAGADLYLPKPYEILDLIRWVEYFLR